MSFFEAIDNFLNTKKPNATTVVSTANAATGKQSLYNIRTAGISTKGSQWKSWYPPTSKAGQYNNIEKGTPSYFSLSPNNSSDLSDTENNFWQMIILSLTEVHEEKYHLHNVVTDSVAVFSTGAKPVEITIVGKLLVTDTEDHNYKFLRQYIDNYRPRKFVSATDSLRTNQDNPALYFYVKDTSFTLLIQNINMETKVENETYVDIGITGIAYGYKMTDSSVPFSLGYYGKTEDLKSVDYVPKPKKNEQQQAQPTAEPGVTVQPKKDPK